MMKRPTRSLCLIVSCLCISQATAADQIVPLPAAHAHNDYYHPRPLLDALAQGFCSIEADIFLVDGQLLIGHSRDELSAKRSLQHLYLDPLQRRVEQNGGQVYAAAARVILLIDIKSDGPSTYRALDTVLQEYASMLTCFDGGRVIHRGVTAIISGNRPTEIMAAQSKRFAFVDGRLSDLERDVDTRLMPLISDRWTSHFTWNGEGPIPVEEREKLHRIVQRTHRRGQQLRFWATPERTNVWQTLHDAGVDFINTDDLTGLAEFLNGQRADRPASP